MTLKEFKESLSNNSPPADISAALVGLWYDARGDWKQAHQTVQDDSSQEAAWVHAYLHRKEGDDFNARYWYTRARRKKFEGSFKEEWEEIVEVLLLI